MDKFKAMRSQVLKRAMLSFVVAVAALFAWVYLYGLMDIDSKVLFFSGLAVVGFGWYFGYIAKLEKRLVCPVCKQSLTDADGWDVFVKACPHCNATLR